MSTCPRQHWFRFSLRTLFVVVTGLCCWLGWEVSVVRQRQAVLKKLRTDPIYTVTTANEWARRYPSGLVDQQPARMGLVRRLLGDEAIQEIGYRTHYREISKAELADVARAFPEAKLLEDHPPLVPCHPGCFPEGTLVDTPHGPRAIESIQQGDTITTMLPDGEWTTAAVQSLFNTSNRLWRIDTTAGVLLTTQTQPLCVSADRARPAGQLQAGDSILYYAAGESRPSSVLAVAPTHQIAPVFNLVLDNSGIFVADGFLARSKPPAAAGR